MQRLFSFFLILMISFGLLASTAQAKRFGGGRSVGVQRSVFNTPRMQQPMQALRQGSPMSKWLGPLAGLATGGLLAYLMMGHGFGSGLLSWLVIGAVALFLINLLRSKRQMATEPPMHQPMSNQQSPPLSPMWTEQNDAHASRFATTYPQGFDADAFLRAAKVKFIRLQAAYDTKNVADLRLFTTPEVFAEVQLQLQERGDQANQTDVLKLDAQLLEATTEFQVMFASVEFSGSIREEDAPPAAFTEIWHFRKDNQQADWLVAGISQQ